MTDNGNKPVPLSAEENKRDTMDRLIDEHLIRFTENNSFKSSAEHWLQSGKMSGSFRASLHLLMEEYTSLKESGEIEQLRKELDERNGYYESKIEKLQAIISANHTQWEQDQTTINQQKEQIERLEKEKQSLQIDASNHAYSCDRAKQERDEAERISLRYKEQINGLVSLIKKIEQNGIHRGPNCYSLLNEIEQALNEAKNLKQ
jgi:chromosome segregation ATPase